MSSGYFSIMGNLDWVFPEIDKILNYYFDCWTEGISYEFIKYNNYPYSKWLNCKISDDFKLDGRYEAKAHEWLVKNRSSLGDKVLFWVVGNTKELVI